LAFFDSWFFSNVLIKDAALKLHTKQMFKKNNDEIKKEKKGSVKIIKLSFH